jgi:hypothetical protein
MHSNKSLGNERMRSTRIKKYCSRGRVDTERTQHNFRRLLSCIRGHMVHFSSVRWSGVELLIAILVRWNLQILFLRRLISKVTSFTTSVACIGVVGRTILHRNIIGHSLAWCLLTSLQLGAPVAILLLVLRALLVLVPLRVLATVPLIRWPLVSLLETLCWVGSRAYVAPRGLSLKPPLLFHLLAHIANYNSAVHQRLVV